MTDFYEQMDAAVAVREQAEQQADRLAEQLTDAAEMLRKWRTENISPDPPIPTSNQVCDLKQKWLDAQRLAGKVLRDAHDADQKTFERLRKLYPDMEMDTSVRYRGHDQS